ncbi:OmpH family outer membrane protein [Chitinophaga horti]|uniref:OmpH family outer membrane protein n=1 Tax=Chitinophaga horti TaxID=2920382 RepID=A0ABY6J275_9BACT|nr:OmpH family outer membrane protein [Chitinophaga horti]UYQ93769.1 OmpH family outer membrane protein [Chitinophaga horti]
MIIHQQIVKNGFLLIAIAGFMASCQPKDKAATQATGAQQAAGGAEAGGAFKIAYVDLDSLESHYEYFKEKKAELEKQQEQIENELKAKARVLQNEVAALQQRAQSGQLSQVEGQAAERELMQKNQQLELTRQQRQQSYMQQEAQFNDDLQNKLDSFLQGYNKGRYAYIFSYRKGASNILYKDTQYDITADVIKGLNDLGNTKK